MRRMICSVWLCAVLAVPAAFAQPYNWQGQSDASAVSLRLDQNTETLTGNKTLTAADLPVQRLDPGGSDRDATLPAEASSTDLTFWIYNDADGSGEDLTVKNDAPAAIVTLAPGMGMMFTCDGTDWAAVGNDGLAYDAQASTISTTSPVTITEGGGSGATPNVYADQLVVDKNNETGVSILTPNNKYGYLVFGDPDDASIGGVAYNHSTDTLYLRAGGGNDVNVDSSGNVNVTSGTVDVTGVTDGNIPYMQSTGAGFGDSPLSTDGTDVTNSGALNQNDVLTVSPDGTNETFQVNDGTLDFTDGNAGTTGTLTVDSSGNWSYNKNIVSTGNVAGATYGSDSSISDAELLTLDDGAVTEVLVGGGAGSAPVWTTATGTGAPARADSPTFTTKITTPEVETSELTNIGSSESVADESEITLATGVSGWGFAQAGDNEEWMQFSFTAAGVVTVIANSANAVNTDTDGNLCVYDAGSGIAIKNRLGASKTIRYTVHYSS